MEFQLKSKFSPTGDQPQAIDRLVRGLKSGYQHQTLLGVTGSGKTFTMANVIQQLQKPTLIISHNKTLAAQLASEFKEFFPNNAVNYFVSYYDYYQPEAYVPQRDLYIEKETQINEEIDRLRHASTNALLTRKDVIIVASVSCIYGLGSPTDYEAMKITITEGESRKRDKLLRQLTDLQYTRNDLDFYRGNFRVRGDTLDIFPIESKDEVIRVQFYGDKIEKVRIVDYLTGQEINKTINQEINIFPAKHFVTPEEKLKSALGKIREELQARLAELKKKNLLVEAQRLEQRTNYDLEMIEHTGYCNGIENYSRFITSRETGEPPATLLDYYPDDFLLFIDESHMTVPQINGMYNGDRARKQTLVDFGFRLPSAMDNRPLKFKEFESHINQAVYVSATPAAWEYRQSGVKTLSRAEPRGGKVPVGNLIKEVVDLADLKKVIDDPKSAVSQQVIRPTGLIEPAIEIRKTKAQLLDLIKEIEKTVKKKQRVLVTTLTKRLAEEIAEYLHDQKIKVAYLHSEVQTLDRLDILRDLRLGKFDVLVGINLLREGLDLPEVSLVAILDADKEGFLRSETSLIQTMGRASRHLEGRVIMYADNITGSMKRAMAEVERRRVIQTAYNKKHSITPKTIIKAIREDLRFKNEDLKIDRLKDYRNIPQDEIKHLLSDLESQMKLAADNLEFEKAAAIRDQVKILKKRK
ncbi:MAG: excinuclease ABC subunit UvrB [Candidatus Komeilibacteria bacterium]|nr:excinuclease ABC subunit UvrB [Candidatus Komeilibacteria bacterium]